MSHFKQRRWWKTLHSHEEAKKSLMCEGTLLKDIVQVIQWWGGGRIAFSFWSNKSCEYQIDLYHKIPELLKLDNNLNEFTMLCEKLYIMGNYINKIWKEN